MPKQIKVTDELYERLKARANGQPIPQLLRSLLDGEKDEGDALLERLDYASEHPESTLSPDDQALIDNLQPGELPDCCQEIYNSYPVDPKDVCKHWTKGYVNYYGRKVLGYQNTLTGGTYFEYQPLYQQ